MAQRNTVLIHAPVGRDPELMVKTLVAAGMAAVSLPDFAALLDAVKAENAGALLLTVEALSTRAVGHLVDVLAQQAHWSDLSVLILVPGGRESSIMSHLETLLLAVPNLTLLERPIRPATLLSVVRNALRSRLRQYEVKRIMEERDRTALAMVESEKLAAVGRLASSIAHEINNPLEAVTNLLYLLRGDTDLSQTGRDYLEMADRELTRVSQIASQTLRFHRQSTSATQVRPEVLLDEVLDIYKSRLAGSGIEIVREYEPGATLTCYEGEIRQVLSNLVGNAFDVLRGGGRLRVRARCMSWWATGQLGVLYTIADDGPGMSASTRERVFEAFYSTKGIHGTGLGLWISKRIVHKHRGHLLLRSRMGVVHGTVFRLWLPSELADTAGEAWHTDEAEGLTA